MNSHSILNILPNMLYYLAVLLAYFLANLGTQWSVEFNYVHINKGNDLLLIIRIGLI